MLRPIKSLGQNFLRDENILRNIAASMDIRAGDVVVEIGPGEGALTRQLTGKRAMLYGFEIDRRAVGLLEERFHGEMTVVQGDFLVADLVGLARSHESKLRIAGNIPYYITSEILFRLFDMRSAVRDATLTMQWEVARRLTAPPGNKDYGILSVFTQYYTDCRLLFKVSRNCFYPKPDVDSAVVRLDFKDQLPECREDLFRSVVRATFGKRRKTLRNGLKSMQVDDGVLDRIGCDLSRRPEELGVNDFLFLTKALDASKAG